MGPHEPFPKEQAVYAQAETPEGQGKTTSRKRTTTKTGKLIRYQSPPRAKK